MNTPLPFRNVSLCLENNHPVEYRPIDLMKAVFTLLGIQKHQQFAIEIASKENFLRRIIESTEDQELQEFLEIYFRSNKLSIFIKELILSLLEEQEKDYMLSYFSNVIGKQL